MGWSGLLAKDVQGPDRVCISRRDALSGCAGSSLLVLAPKHGDDGRYNTSDSSSKEERLYRVFTVLVQTQESLSRVDEND
jgi:hypothetical protein